MYLKNLGQLDLATIKKYRLNKKKISRLLLLQIEVPSLCKIIKMTKDKEDDESEQLIQILPYSGSYMESRPLSFHDFQKQVCFFFFIFYFFTLQPRCFISDTKTDRILPLPGGIFVLTYHCRDITFYVICKQWISVGPDQPVPKIFGESGEALCTIIFSDTPDSSLGKTVPRKLETIQRPYLKQHQKVKAHGLLHLLKEDSRLLYNSFSIP